MESAYSRAESVRIARVDIETAASLPQVLVAILLCSPMAAATNLRLESCRPGSSHTVGQQCCYYTKRITAHNLVPCSTFHLIAWINGSVITWFAPKVQFNTTNPSTVSFWTQLLLVLKTEFGGEGRAPMNACTGTAARPQKKNRGEF